MKKAREFQKNIIYSCFMDYAKAFDCVDHNELWKILKDDAVKVVTHYASKYGKLSSCHRPGKGEFSFQSQRKTMPKNAQITEQLHSSRMLVK